MSWEDIRTLEESCPCGAGLYTVTLRSDDWGRSEQRWEMICSECADTYELSENYLVRKGMTENNFSWVPKY